MSKAILVMDMPENCIDCRFCRETDEGIKACCEIVDEPYGSSLCRMIDSDYCQCRPSWCPLQDPPDEEEYNGCDEFADGYTYGWNECLEEILR